MSWTNPIPQPLPQRIGEGERRQVTSFNNAAVIPPMPWGDRGGLDRAMAESDPKIFDGWAHTHTDRAVYRDIQERARLMRRNPTPAENILWQRLRQKQVGGFYFRRQHPIGHFIVDFYCAEAKLVIEVDGSVHRQPGHHEYDADRQLFLEHLGVNVIRFDNAQVLQETDAVVEAIAEAALRLARGE